MLARGNENFCAPGENLFIIIITFIFLFWILNFF